MITNYLYGVCDSSGSYTDVSKTLRGAKQYATRNGYKEVYSRNTNHYYVNIKSEKIGSKWVDVTSKAYD